MIKANEKEVAVIQKAFNRKLAIEELLDKALMKPIAVRNKELLHDILDEYVNMNRIIDTWWEKMGERYGFNHNIPHNVNFKTGIISEGQI